MFVEKVMKKIWEGETELYQSKRAEFMEWPLDRLVNHLKLVIDAKAESNEDRDTEMQSTLLPSSGCPHWNQKNYLSPCSFCDYFSNNLLGYVMMDVLKEKSDEKYAEIVRYGFDKARGRQAKAQFSEHVQAFDTMNDEEISEDNFRQLFSTPLFSGNIRIFTCETRASSVTRDKVKAWKKRVGRWFAVENGVDTSHAWVRNHWLNKRITNTDIRRAWDILHDENCRVINDVLLGVPGLTDRQSVALFKKSLEDLTGADHIVISPLVRKGRELQSTMYRFFASDREMLRRGIAKEDLTGTIHILSVYRAFIDVFAQNPAHISKYLLSPPHFGRYFDFLHNHYRYSRYYPEVVRCIDALEDFNATKNMERLRDRYEAIAKTSFFVEHRDRYESEAGVDDLAETFLYVATGLKNKLFGDTDISEFEKELSRFDWMAAF